MFDLYSCFLLFFFFKFKDFLLEFEKSRGRLTVNLGEKEPGPLFSK